MDKLDIKFPEGWEFKVNEWSEMRDRRIKYAAVYASRPPKQPDKLDGKMVLMNAYAPEHMADPEWLKGAIWSATVTVYLLVETEIRKEQMKAEEEEN